MNGAAGEQLLEVVGDQQQVLGGQEALGGLVGGLAREHDDPERVDDRPGNVLGPVQRGERDKRGAVGEVRLDCAPGLHGKSRLADPARPGEREHPHRPGQQPLADGDDVPLAPDRPVGRHRESAGAQRSRRRRERLLGRRSHGRRELSGVPEDVLVEIAQRLRRFDAELVDEPSACRLEGGQRVGLPSGAIERQHLQLDEALLEGMRDDQCLQLAQQFAVAAELEVELDPFDDRGESLLLRAGRVQR